MPHYESGFLDNSDCKRLRISSLVDMPAEEDTYDLCASANDLVDEMRSLDADM